jgi:hypothetical protein
MVILFVMFNFAVEFRILPQINLVHSAFAALSADFVTVYFFVPAAIITRLAWAAAAIVE